MENTVHCNPGIAIERIRHHVADEYRALLTDLSSPGLSTQKLPELVMSYIEGWETEREVIEQSIGEIDDKDALLSMSCRAIALKYLLNTRSANELLVYLLEGRRSAKECQPEIAFFRAFIDEDDLIEKLRCRSLSLSR